MSLGDLHSAVISTSGSLYTFGDNSKGQLGLGPRAKIHVESPQEVIDVPETVRQVACGFRHTLVLANNGNVYGMGNNRRHELGLGESARSREPEFNTPLKLSHLEIHRITKVAAGGFSAAVTVTNQLIIWGTGQFGAFRTPQKVCMDDVRFCDIQIAKTEDDVFAAAVDINGTVYSWGENYKG